MSNVLRSDWSTELPAHTNYYVTWGATHGSEGEREFGKLLGKLNATDLSEIIHKATISFSMCVHIVYTQVYSTHCHIIYNVTINRTAVRILLYLVAIQCHLNL